MDQISALKIFHRVVELKSFAAAARDLGYSNAAISKNISELEAHLGTRLLTRTTRSMSLTEAGEVYYSRSVSILEDLDEAKRDLLSLKSSPRGRLRIAAPMTVGLLQFSQVLPQFLKLYPEIEVDLVLDDRRVDLVEQGFDVALRAGGALPDSSLVARKLFDMPRVTCASAHYFAAHGIPQSPEDLTGHQCLAFSLSASPRRWLYEKNGETKTIQISGRLMANSSIALRHQLLGDLGIALIPHFVVADDLAEGRLQAILEDWEPDPQAIYAVYADREFIPQKVRVFIDFLVEHFAGK